MVLIDVFCGDRRFTLDNTYLLLPLPPPLANAIFLPFLTVVVFIIVDGAEETSGGVAGIGVIGKSGEGVGERLSGKDDDGENGNDVVISGIA